MIIKRFNSVFGSSFHPVILLAIATMLILAVAGCGGDDAAADAPDTASADVQDGADVDSLITQPDRVYSVEDFLAVGWKKSKQLETDSLDGAIDAWYGFYSQKDIELRFYESHDAAIEFGVGPAKETTQRGTGARIGAATVWTVNIALYGAYAVAGNVVMMCELELSSCESLIDSLK